MIFSFLCLFFSIAPFLFFVSQILCPPQLRRLSTAKVLDNPFRQRIISLLRNYEFEHFLGLKTKLNCGSALLSWHLQVLEDFNFIKRIKFGRINVFFLKKSSLDNFKLKLYCSIRNSTSFIVLVAFLEKEDGIWDIKKLSKKLKKSYKLVKYHYDKLFTLGLLEKQDYYCYKIVNPRKGYINWLIRRNS